MLLTEILGTKFKEERKKRVVPAPKVNPAKIASEYRKVKATGENQDHSDRLWRDLVGAVGEDKAKALVSQQNSIKKDSQKDVWGTGV